MDYPTSQGPDHDIHIHSFVAPPPKRVDGLPVDKGASLNFNPNFSLNWLASPFSLIKHESKTSTNDIQVTATCVLPLSQKLIVSEKRLSRV